MNTSHLPYILAIASTGSLSAASRQLGVSQPALSKYLKKLEQETGMELFFPNQKKYVPTLAGRLYIQTAQRILEQIRHADKAIAALSASEGETIRVGLSPNRGIETMAGIFPEFNNRYPQVELALREGYANDLKELLLRGELDVVIATHAGISQDGLSILPVHDEELVLAVPAFHPAVRHSDFHIEDLPYADLREFRDSVFIMPSTSSTLYALTQSIFEEYGFHPQLSISNPNIVMQEALIRSGTRVGFLPAYYVRPNREIAYFRLRSSARLTMTFITRSGHTFSRPERYLLYLLMKHQIHTAGTTIQWSDFLERVMWEFDPIEAAAQRLEAPV